MEIGRLYFVKEEYYDKYGQFGLLYNKENVDGREHNRPCCYLFKYSESNIYWMIPLSTKVDKYEREFENSIKKYGICDNISFGYVLGKKMCLFITKYVSGSREIYFKYVHQSSNRKTCSS